MSQWHNILAGYLIVALVAKFHEKNKKSIVKFKKSTFNGRKNWLYSDLLEANGPNDVTRPCLWLSFSQSADSLACLKHNKLPKISIKSMGSHFGYFKIDFYRHFEQRKQIRKNYRRLKSISGVRELIKKTWTDSRPIVAGHRGRDLPKSTKWNFSGELYSAMLRKPTVWAFKRCPISFDKLRISEEIFFIY